MPITPELVAGWAAVFERLGPWAFGALVLVLYRKQIVAALQRSTQNPLVEAIRSQSAAIEVQSAHFAENNRLFLALGPALQSLVKNTGDTATQSAHIADLLTELLAVQRGIKEELIRGAAK